MHELIGQLMKETGLGQEQAEGGLGAILNLIKTKASQQDFGKLQDLLGGDAVAGFLKKAPSDGGAMGKLGGLLGGLGGGKGLGNLAMLAGLFKQLQIDPGVIPQFGSILGKFLEDKGAGHLTAILESLSKK
ncbi:MAG: DUF2780 domain-containing protein [Verrucomicrobiota bacterium]